MYYFKSLFLQLLKIYVWIRRLTMHKVQFQWEKQQKELTKMVFLYPTSVVEMFDCFMYLHIQKHFVFLSFSFCLFSIRDTNPFKRSRTVQCLSICFVCFLLLLFIIFNLVDATCNCNVYYLKGGCCLCASASIPLQVQLIRPFVSLSHHSF